MDPIPQPPDPPADPTRASLWATYRPWLAKLAEWALVAAVGAALHSLGQ